MNYKGKPWIQSREVEKALKAFFNLIALGSTSLNPDGIVLMGALEKEEQACANVLIYPTLSPKDPAFDEWSESEEREKDTGTLSGLGDIAKGLL